MIKRVAVLLIAFAVLQYCTSARLAPAPIAAKQVKVTYQGQVKSLIVTKCGPCHLDSGNEVSYDNYESAKENINDIIRRMKLEPSQHGFMPQKGNRLPDSVIQVFEKWKVDSLLEK